ncbi:MAG: hypothetical protein ABIQ32_01685 [Sphingomicrobium sp.]
MRLLRYLDRPISAWAYAVAAPLLLLAPHGVALFLFWAADQPLQLNASFWIFPLGRISALQISYWLSIAGYALGLAASWALVVLSMRRANLSGMGYLFVLAIPFPWLQLLATAVLAVLPRRRDSLSVPPEDGSDIRHIMEGLFAGVAIIVLAVLISAVTFGAYGWGLFVGTPLIVGLTTAYLANRRLLLSAGKTTNLVIAAAALGSLALIMFALEGLVCVILVSPLGAFAAAIGGWVGREIAIKRHHGGKSLYCIALLPLAFAAEAATPPAALIMSSESLEIAAPPERVWEATIAPGRIDVPANAVARAGLAYPLGSRIRGSGVGAIRLGLFSTGTAIERVTEWKPGKRLTFEVLQQPPAMEEMSPYRRVHAPHVHGYFETGETRFEMHGLANGKTRLMITAAHRLRIDPLPYWEPIARWAIRENCRRVLEDIRLKAEARD